MRTEKTLEFLDLVRTGLTVYYLEQVVREQAEEDAAMWVMNRLGAAYAAAPRIPRSMPACKAAEDFVAAIRNPAATPEWLEETVEARKPEEVPWMVVPP